jgi:hypothetical protein
MDFLFGSFIKKWAKALNKFLSMYPPAFKLGLLNIKFFHVSSPALLKSKEGVVYCQIETLKFQIRRKQLLSLQKADGGRIKKMVNREFNAKLMII